VCVLHHQRKTTGMSARAGEALRGHSSIEAAIDTAILVARDDLNVTMESTKDRGMRVAPFGAEFEYKNDPHHEMITARFWPADPLTEETEALSRKAIIEADALDALKKHGTLSANQIFDKIGGNRLQVLDVLRQMAARGDLGQKQASRGYVLYIPALHPEFGNSR
jgi:hypothetical protein